MLLIGGGDQNIKALNVSKLSKYSCHINSILQLPMNEQKMPTSSPKSTLWLLLPTAQLVFPSLQNIIKKEGYILKCMNSKQWQPGRFRHFNHYCCQFYVRINNITFQSEVSNVIERGVALLVMENVRGFKASRFKTSRFCVDGKIKMARFRILE